MITIPKPTFIATIQPTAVFRYSITPRRAVLCDCKPFSIISTRSMHTVVDKQAFGDIHNWRTKFYILYLIYLLHYLFQVFGKVSAIFHIKKHFFQPPTSWRLSEGISVSMVWMLSNYYSCSRRFYRSIDFSGAVGDKTGKTSVLSGFSEKECNGGSGGTTQCYVGLT